MQHLCRTFRHLLNFPGWRLQPYTVCRGNDFTKRAELLIYRLLLNCKSTYSLAYCTCFFQGASLNLTLAPSQSENCRVRLPSLLGTKHTDKNKVHGKLLVHCLALRNTTRWAFWIRNCRFTVLFPLCLHFHVFFKLSPLRKGATTDVKPMWSSSPRRRVVPPGCCFSLGIRKGFDWLSV